MKTPSSSPMLYVKTLHETGEPHQFSRSLKLIPTDTSTGNTSSGISKYRHVIKIRACRETLSWRHNRQVPAFRFNIAWIRSIPTAHVTAVACPYKELAGRVCMHFGCVRTHFQVFMNLAEIFFLRWFSEVRKKHFRRNFRKCSRMRTNVLNCT